MIKRVLKIIPLSFLILSIIFTGCTHNTSIDSTLHCVHCGKTITSDAVFCSYCGKEQDNTTKLDSEAILGQWETYDESWGKYLYTFYIDGTCVGKYIGKDTGKIVGVEPSIYPESYYEGCGDGYWHFSQGEFIPLLTISYKGDRSGDGNATLQYEYHFNEDYTKLTIYGVSTYGNHSRGSIVWTKVN